MASLQLRIPKERIVGFATLLALEEQAFKELLLALENCPLVYDSDNLLSNLVSNISTIPKEDAQRIFTSLIPLYTLQVDSELSIPDFTDEILSALEKSDSSEIDVAGINGKTLKARLVKILSVSSVHIASKAIDILTEHEHVFQDARVFTDIRPVFAQDPKTIPSAAVIVQTLRLRYGVDRELKEFFIALDTTDVQKLIDVLERAKLKSESLKLFLKNSKITYVNSE